MAPITEKLEDIEAQIAKLHAARTRVLSERSAEIGKLAERLSVLVYSDAAIEKRINQISQLRNLCVSLARAGAETLKKPPEEKEHEERPPSRR